MINCYQIVCRETKLKKSQRPIKEKEIVVVKIEEIFFCLLLVFFDWLIDWLSKMRVQVSIMSVWIIYTEQRQEKKKPSYLRYIHPRIHHH